MIYSESQAQKHLLENNRDYKNRLTWQNAIQGVNAQANNAQAKLAEQYVNASADAYTSYLKNQNALKSSNVVGLGQQNLLEQNNLALQDAYNTYAQNLSEGQAKIENSRLAGMEQISSALEQQAKYTADYTNAHIDYLKELYRQYEAGENQLFDDPEWARYLEYTTPTYDSQGNIVYDEDGNIVYDKTIPSLISDKNLMGLMYDDKGLTFQGADILDQLEHQIAQSGYGGSNYSWSDYLAETNPELLEWANTYNPYNYTPEGTNAATLNTMYGIASDDYTYQFAERLAGLPEESLRKYLTDLFNASENENVTKDNYVDVLNDFNYFLIDNGLEGLEDEDFDNFIEDVLNIDKKYDEIVNEKVKLATHDDIGTYEKALRKKFNVQRDNEITILYNDFIKKIVNRIAKTKRDEEIAFNNRTGR